MVSNLVHTKTPFGRGWDTEIGCATLKLQADQVTGALGREDMSLAVDKYTDNKIITLEDLQKIISDPDFKEKLEAKLTVPQKSLVGVPLGIADLPNLPVISKFSGKNVVITSNDSLSANSKDSLEEQGNDQDDSLDNNQNNNNPPQNRHNFRNNRIQRRHTK